MVFSSLIFLFAFLPLALVFYWIAPHRLKNAVLFGLSLLFYGWGEPIYLFLMLFSIASAYGFGFLIAKHRQRQPKRAKWAMIASVSVSLMLLFFFKYYNFFAVNLSRLPWLTVPIIEQLLLPIGISFYTFQIISYTVDLYRGDCSLQRNFVLFGTYVTLFPQLIAGPIVRYHDIDCQLRERHPCLEDVACGVTRFSAGLAKKVLVGDVLAAGYEYARNLSALSPGVLGAWMTAVFFALHLYYDFSGYSDMAIGLGRMFGFRFPENFNYPYIAKSITEFWRRWHISLSTWFREYIYIPLGGNRRGRFRTYRNLAIVWLLTGFWHGASWNFVLWGMYFAVILILEKAFLLRLLSKLPSAFQHLYAVFLILVGFLIFSHPDLGLAWTTFLRMFGVGDIPLSHVATEYRLLRMLPLLFVSVLGATPLPIRIWRSILGRHSRVRLLKPILSLFVLMISTAYLVDSTFSPFAYTQF